ncbi:hypothetical protein LOK49_LG10G00678 [Camellia lanceoleosa]|uniref:Uncharacterized protein n=1 Tax=Camellia lanceoleosa TaxID=1840588 RepID=A0ACC0GDJ9_9ERIC|nr:hypothetical protein LOK49_LG10G00678 [Camellia lanceoleosa]
MPLQFANDLGTLFSDAAATREWAYTHILGVMPQTDKTPEQFHTLHDAEFHDDVDLEVVHPSELNKKRSSNTDGSLTKSKTKKKFTGATLLNKTLDRIVNRRLAKRGSSSALLLRFIVVVGCDQPLTVRFADPKRPRAGESRYFLILHPYHILFCLSYSLSQLEFE